jgi:hypothetical protein
MAVDRDEPSPALLGELAERIAARDVKLKPRHLPVRLDEAERQRRPDRPAPVAGDHQTEAAPGRECEAHGGVHFAGGMDVHRFGLRLGRPPKIGLVAGCSRRCAAEPSPAARATITCDRQPIPPRKGGGGRKSWSQRSSWRGAIAAIASRVKQEGRPCRTASVSYLSSQAFSGTCATAPDSSLPG